MMQAAFAQHARCIGKAGGLQYRVLGCSAVGAGVCVDQDMCVRVSWIDSAANAQSADTLSPVFHNSGPVQPCALVMGCVCFVSVMSAAFAQHARGKGKLVARSARFPHPTRHCANVFT